MTDRINGKLCQQGICRYCGASKQNGYRHDPDCLCNVAGGYEHSARYWHSGYDETMTHYVFVGHLVSPRTTTAQRVARMQGRSCAARKRAAESALTLQAVDQAIDIARRKPDSMSERIVPRYTS